MTVRTIDEIFRDFVTDGVPASGPFNPHKSDIRDTLKALTEGSEDFPDNRVIRLNNANEGTANNIVVTASVAIPAAAYQVLYILNVTQENTGPVTVSGAINRDLVTNINQPVPVGYLTPGMALLCIDTGSELRLLSYGDAETVAQAAEDAAARAEDAAAVAESAAGGLLSNFDTASAVAAANIQGPVNYARTAGYSTVGDGGAALYKRVAAEPSHIGKIQSADGAWWEIADRVLRPEMFGIKGDGSDETALLQGMFDFAAGKEVVLPYGANYGITSITLPVGLRLKAKGAIFNKLAASTSYAINIPGYVTFDNIILTTPGGGDDRGVRVNGDFVTGDVLQAVATAEANGYGVRIEGASASSRIGNIRIAKITTGNFSSQIQAFYVSRLWIGDMRMTNYVTGFYIRDAIISQFDNIFASGLHSAALGGPGENGVLLESVTADYATDNVSFGKVTVRDSGEHAVRIGGVYVMRDIHFEKIATFNTGSVPGNASTGGAAFKALLNGSNSGRHENITVDSLYFEDCSNSSGGLRNMSAVQVSRCRDGYVNNIIGRKRNNTYSCIFGINVVGSENFHFDNPDIRDVRFAAFNPLAESLQEGIRHVTVNGGYLHSLSDYPVCYYEPDADAVFNNVRVIGTRLAGGRTAARFNAPTGSGSYINCVLDVEFTDPVATPVGGVVESQASIQLRIRTNIASPVGATCANGSTWQDFGRGEFYIRRSGAWVAA